ncbi:Sin-like protein conserved region-domain-containing protein [Mortierella sp. GBAus27b]|nr:DNA-directed RNA polymerase III subunit RPC5 [Mortierella sp. GBA43]KAI8353576.1 Sin-like protein conserved region-domain-containing protein [Mortierella sp. GBAus27b]
MSFKPKVSGSARSRKKAPAQVEGGDSDIDTQMNEDDGDHDGNIIEDETQMLEDMEEERLKKGKYVSQDDLLVVESAGSRSKGKGKQEEDLAEDTVTQPTKTDDDISLQDLSSQSERGDDYSMDLDIATDDFDLGTPLEQETKLPDFADEGDELVKEVPVYLSQRLAKHLYLFQYPVRGVGLAYTEGTGPNKARIKPISQLIELELPIDTGASQYNRDRGEELAMGMNDKALRTALDSEPEPDETRELLDKQILVSSLMPNATNYLAGVLRNDEMHLTPIHGVVQLRPSFKYLDKIDEKKKQATKKVTDEENKEELAKQKAELEQKAKALQVQVRSAADSEALKASGPNKARLADEENWTKLDYFDTYSEEADTIYNSMFAGHVGELECITSVNEYLDLVSSNNSLRNVKTEQG